MYSTVAQARSNSSKITTDAMTNDEVTAMIEEADARVQEEFGKWLDFSDVGTYPGTDFPKLINMLSQYMTAILCLQHIFGAVRQAEEVSDIQWFEKELDRWRTKFENGDIPDGLGTVSTNEYEQTKRVGVRPALGGDELGEFADDDEMEDLRGEM